MTKPKSKPLAAVAEEPCDEMTPEDLFAAGEAPEDDYADADAADAALVDAYTGGLVAVGGDGALGAGYGAPVGAALEAAFTTPPDAGLTACGRMAGHTPDQLRRAAVKARDGVERCYWALSEAMHRIHDGGLFQAWGFERFGDYVERDLDFEMGKANYLVRLWDWRQRLPTDVQAQLDRVGCSKARLIATVATGANAADWLQRIEGRTVKEIVALVKGANASEAARLDSLPTEQAITEEEGKPAIQQKAEIVKLALYRAPKDTFDRATGKAMDIAGTDSLSHAVDLICTEFLASHLGVNDPGAYLEGVERATGLRLVAIDGAGRIVHGGDVLDAAVAQDAAGEEPEDGDAPAGEPAHVCCNGAGLPDPIKGLAACLAAVEDRAGIRLVAYAPQDPRILYGATTLEAVCDEPDPYDAEAPAPGNAK
jgi:hypothetical protein